jgi:hypothetical protein
MKASEIGFRVDKCKEDCGRNSKTMSHSRILLLLVVGLASALAVSIPSESTQAVGSGSTGQDSQNHNAGAEAYKKLLPELAAAHRKKFDQQLSQLKRQTEELKPQLLSAQKQTGLNLDSITKQIGDAATPGDAGQLTQAQSKIFNTYESQLAKRHRLTYSTGRYTFTRGKRTLPSTSNDS